MPSSEVIACVEASSTKHDAGRLPPEEARRLLVRASMAVRVWMLLAPIAFAACIDTPQLTTAPGAAAAPDVHEGMVLVPAASLDAANVSPPAPKGGGDGKGSGDGKGKNDGGPPPPPDAGGPASPPGMGDPPSPSADAGGGSATSVAPFWLDARETARGDYDACVDAGACEAATCDSLGPTYPVTCVSRADAAAYCAWRGKRLPTNDEWTAAAAGPLARAYPWGDAAPSADRLNACGDECASRAGMYPTSDGFATAAPSGRFPLGATPEGALDLAGNVAEWVDAPASVVRGGSYADADPASVAALASRPVADGSSAADVGLRCALTN